MYDPQGMQRDIDRLKGWRIGLALLSALLAALLIVAIAVFVPANQALSSDNVKIRDQNTELQERLNEAEDHIARTRPLPIVGSLDDTNATGEIKIVIYINRTVDLQNKATLSVKHQKCDEPTEWEFEFEVTLTFEEEYNVTITVNGTQAITELVSLEPLSTLSFKVWMEAAWTGAVRVI